jgi:hypothetical protein
MTRNARAVSCDRTDEDGTSRAPATAVHRGNSTTRDNEERFLLSGAAHRRCCGRTAFGAAPVSKKRIGLNRAPRLPMGFV